MIHVYCMPGMAAGPAIFEYIKLPKENFELHLLEWSIPTKGVSLSEYAKQMSSMVKHENVVLLGVSLGGILVQEMTKFVDVRKSDNRFKRKKQGMSCQKGCFLQDIPKYISCFLQVWSTI